MLGRLAEAVPVTGGLLLELLDNEAMLDKVVGHIAVLYESGELDGLSGDLVYVFTHNSAGATSPRAWA